MNAVREMASKTVRHRGCDTVTTIERWIATGECGSLAVDELIAVLLDQRQDWNYRAWSAMLLASRNEKAATEALFHANQSDPVYWVRRDALRSLQLCVGGLEHEICPV
jgi:hypothetical protein